MSFKNVKLNDRVYGTVYGKGTVCTVLGKDSHYTFEVEYEINSCRVHYTVDGIPNWGSVMEQTVFFEKDIDLMVYDFSPSDRPLKPKEILKLKLLERLEIRCPSGIWTSVERCPRDLYEDYIFNERFHLFREGELSLEK